MVVLIYVLFSEMAARVDLVFHFGGTWKFIDEKLQYVDGETDILYDFDPDYLCYQDMLYRYQNTYGFKTIEKIFVLEPGKELLDGLFLVNDDSTVRRILNYISRYSWVREINFYVDHHVDTPLYMP